MAKFDKEKDELLIESVQSYNALYNKSDKDHKNYIHKHKCWEKVSDVVGMPIPECKKRWKSLRDQYNKKLKEMAGPCASRITATWDYMNLMSFLSEQAPERREVVYCFNNGSDSECDNSQSGLSNAEVNSAVVECEINAKKRKTRHEPVDNPLQVPTTSKKRNVSQMQETVDKQESQRLNLLETLVHNTTTQSQSHSQPQSAIKKFFESMAEVVESFPPREQAIIRAKVCRLVSDTEIKLSTSITLKSEDTWDSD
ncbi:unnamed protein product [Chrysodeixis includens]|uniref:MADF domain-containing protein n=1 Tax=Chrysodeixis includens TaxID=689277 RepID=A0A9P0BMR8_CHRIL|nr:unnamed protein product [Chrysodeixis includens]